MPITPFTVSIKCIWIKFETFGPNSFLLKYEFVCSCLCSIVLSCLQPNKSGNGKYIKTLFRGNNI